MSPCVNDRFAGEIVCRNFEEKMKFETVALQCGYSVTVRPLSDERFNLTIFMDEDLT